MRLALIFVSLIAPGLVAHAASEKLLHSFGQTERDGIFPESGLTYAQGYLIGPTSEGGSLDCKFNLGCGTVFRAAVSGTERVIYTFKGGSQHGLPSPNELLNVGGNLYGTTCCGGSYDAGTVFKITPAGVQTTMHVFGTRVADGSTPYGELTLLKGKLFGTTLRGGTYDQGTVFSITLDGQETVLHSFGGPGDGIGASAGLIGYHGKLYGTTEGGGDSKAGTVFSITPEGAEAVLYSFKNGADGSFPEARLLVKGDALFGTTYYGGGKKCGGTGCGTVFKLTFAGVESVLHSFVGGPDDGLLPESGLVAIGDDYYGTTSLGGMPGSCEGSGTSCGTVFRLSKSGAFSLLHRFPESGADGQYPVGNLVSVGGLLYGLTQGGGVYGLGSLYSIAP